MSSANVARTTVGILGNIIAFILLLSPVPTFITICKNNSVEEYSPLPYLAAFISCMLRTLYSLPMVHPDSTLLLTMSASGCAVQIIYIVLFIVHSDRSTRMRVIMIALAEILFIAIVAVLVLTVVRTTKLRSGIVGAMGILFNIMTYASPLSVMKLVISTKSVEYMPLFVSLATFGCGLVWTIYAFIPFDLFVAIPNGMGTLLAIGQLTLHATCYKSTKRQMEKKKQENAEMGLPQVIVTAGFNGKAQKGCNGGAGESLHEGCRTCSTTHTLPTVR